MNEDLVSIVVPIYNAEKFLDDTIKSVLSQSYTNWELLLINDCSTDQSENIAKKYLSKKIKLYVMDKNSGAALTRNKGIDLAKGRYLCFIDADDLWDSKKIEKQVYFMKKNKCSFSFTGYEFADKDGNPNGKKVFVPRTINYKQALKNTTISTITVMFDLFFMKKKLIEMPNVNSEDTATWWKILKTGIVAHGLNEVLSYYRISGKTLSSNKIVAIKRVWFLYRKVEKFSLFKSLYYFIFYFFNAVRRRI
jgi:teichuronic acid biosynthesis glycosyltransferase TuaG